jgi:hypothetical protein
MKSAIANFSSRIAICLSESVTAQRFTVDGLNSAIDDTIASLASPAGLIAKSLLPRDPTGEFLQVLNQLDRTAQPRSLAGCLGLARWRARAPRGIHARAGSDIDAAERAVQSIRAAFAAAQRSSGTPAARAAQLLVTGPPLFAVEARATIRHEAVRLSIVSTVLIVSLLLAVYRSLPVLLLGLLPVTSGALAGIAAVALGFGVVHGITLAFGITLIGESVDYSIYLFVQSRGAARGRGFQAARAPPVENHSSGRPDFGVRLRIASAVGFPGACATGPVLHRGPHRRCCSHAFCLAKSHAAILPGSRPDATWEHGGANSPARARVALAPGCRCSTRHRRAVPATRCTVES